MPSMITTYCNMTSSCSCSSYPAAKALASHQILQILPSVPKCDLNKFFAKKTVGQLRVIIPSLLNNVINSLLEYQNTLTN